MKTIAIANQKGGTGKTTTTYNLGIALTQQGYRVLMVDFDPQGNLSCYCGIPPEKDLDQTITELLMKTSCEKPIGNRECVYQTGRKEAAARVDFIPSNLRLAGFELAMGTMMCREVLLKSCLEQYSNQYDYCLIDCSPSVGLLLTNALAAANEIIIPMQAQPFSVVGMSQLTSSIANTMGELARASIHFPEILYKEFGIDAEILIDHAWGLEPCGMKEINAYCPETNSLSEGQVLSCPYPYDKARIIVQEMTDSLVFQLTDKGLVTDSLTLDIGYDRENCDKGIYRGPVHIDYYGRTVPKGAHGSTRLDNPTNLSSQLMAATTELFDRIANRNLTVRRITIAANRVVKDQGILQVDLFTDTSKLEREKSLQTTMLGIKKKFGKNAVLKGTNYLEGATMRERNGQIGGHKAK